MRQHNVLNPVMSNLDSRLPLRWIPHQFNDLVLGTTLVCQVLGGFVTEQSKGFFVPVELHPKIRCHQLYIAAIAEGELKQNRLEACFFVFWLFFHWR